MLHRLSPIPTPDDQSEIVRTLCRAVEQLRREHPQVAAVGMGAAGLVDWPSGQIRWGANNAFLRLPLRDLLAEASGLPTVVDNDANTAAWGEARHAALSDLAFLTVGTGVGGGLIVRDRLYRGQTASPRRSGIWSWIPRVANGAAAATSAAWRRWLRAPRWGGTGGRPQRPNRTDPSPRWRAARSA